MRKAARATATLSLMLALAGCSARPPGTVETALASTIKQKLTVGGKKDPNPLPDTERNRTAGRGNFSYYCVVCHRLDAQNTGVPFADTMSPPVPPLSAPAVQAYSDGQLKWDIAHGIFPSGMPASEGILNDDEIWQIVIYLRHLPPKGTLGEPPVYGGQSEKSQALRNQSEPPAREHGHRKMGAP